MIPRPVLLIQSYTDKYAILRSCRLDFLYLAQTWHKLAYFPAYEPFHPSAQGKYCPMSHFRNIKVHVRSLVQLCTCLSGALSGRTLAAYVRAIPDP